MLNSKNWVVGEEVISQGTLDFSTTHPRDIFKAGELLGITVSDHVIIGNGKWWSWREEK